MQFVMRFKYLIFLLLVSMVCLSCDDTINQEDLDNKIIPSTKVSFSQHIQPVFEARCNNAGCHNDQDRASGLSLTSYVNTTSNYLIVAPGTPSNSKLVWVIEGNSTNPMPPIGYRPLTKNQIDGIKNWIKEGAKNN
ncbi:MAG: hypothetical protein FJ214_02345 [Ignavibacteria bacterium]|nr:hypothetical protein [Ignavibacteria bacterium]